VQIGPGAADAVRHPGKGQAPEAGHLAAVVPEHRRPGPQRLLRPLAEQAGRRGGDADGLARGQEPEHGTGQALLVLPQAGNGRGERRVDRVKGDGGGICGHGAGAPSSRAGGVPARGPVPAAGRICLLR
jgi:hypothetical protein